MDRFVVNDDNTRLDEVVLNHYASLDMFDLVLSVNSHLTSVKLAVNDVVNLPILVKKEVEESLW